MIIKEIEALNYNCCQRTQQTRKPCEGSRCMAWRWAEQKNRDEPKWNADGSAHSTTHGYCGLAGKT